MERVVEDTEIGHLLHAHPYDLSGGTTKGGTGKGIAFRTTDFAFG